MILPSNDHFPDLPDPTPFTADEVLKALETSAIGSTTGGSRLMLTNLRELERADGSDLLRSLRRHLGELEHRIAKGRLPPSASALFASAPLTPLREKDDGVQQIGAIPVSKVP